MTKPTVYRIQLHDGSLPGQPLPPERGLFELRDAEWRLHFRHLDPAVTCGLLRSDVEVRAIDRRRCLITLSGRDTPEFTLHLVVRARARRVRADIEHRRNRLGRERELLDAVRDGRWWRDDRIFDRFGPLKTVSITGARYLGGLARTVRVKPTRGRSGDGFRPAGHLSSRMAHAPCDRVGSGRNGCGRRGRRAFGDRYEIATNRARDATHHGSSVRRICGPLRGVGVDRRRASCAAGSHSRELARSDAPRGVGLVRLLSGKRRFVPECRSAGDAHDADRGCGKR